jgi:hypothetical protein
MNNEQRKAAPHEFLSGWKDIANYLDKGVRTVQRYEHDMGLPVRRPGGKPRGSVIATVAEIAAWVTARQSREELQLSRQPTTSHSVDVDAIRSNVLEMQKLREEMTALRAEVHLCREQLREKITSLLTNLGYDQPQKATPRRDLPLIPARP